LQSPQEYPDSAAYRKRAIKGGCILGGIREIGISIKPSVQHRPDILLHMIHQTTGAMISAPAAAWLAASRQGKEIALLCCSYQNGGKGEPISLYLRAK